MKLTPREEEVAALVARGYTQQAIARKLGISLKTVQSHIYSIARQVPGPGRPMNRIIVWMKEDDTQAA